MTQKEYYHQYYLNHKEKMIEKAKKWAKENQEKRIEIRNNWAENNLDKVKESRKRWKDNNKEYDIQYNKTKSGRAHKLITAYKHSDKLYNRGEGDLTAQWIIDNIFSKPCAHCGETDWHKLGCNRLDNSRPHTMDNVEPCCAKCNNSLPRK